MENMTNDALKRIDDDIIVSKLKIEAINKNNIMFIKKVLLEHCQIPSYSCLTATNKNEIYFPSWCVKKVSKKEKEKFKEAATSPLWNQNPMTYDKNAENL